MSEIANGLLSFEQALVGSGNPGDDLPELIDGQDSDDECDSDPRAALPDISNPEVMRKYNLDCPDWLSFKSNCKSADKYCTRVEDFILWREVHYNGSALVTKNDMLSSLILYFDYSRNQKKICKPIFIYIHVSLLILSF